MKALRDRSSRANASFYMTMISMIQSLALGYFATALKPVLLINPVSFTAWLTTFLSYGLVVQMIVITWHEYSIGSICFSWPLGYADSWIPILLGFSEYFVIHFATLDRSPYAFADGRPLPCFFVALVIFSFLAWLAFFHQYRKSVENRSDNGEVLNLVEPYMKSTRKLMFANIFTYLIGFFATWKFSTEWISISFLIIGHCTLIVHALRSKKAFDEVFAP